MPSRLSRGGANSPDGSTLRGPRFAELARMRPPSTRAEGNPEPLWGSYWLVRGLRQLPTAEWLAIAKLWKRDGSGRLATSFVLEGPILIKAP